MKKITSLILAIALLIGSVSALTSCTIENHEHTYANDWTYSDESHWKAATCEHDEKGSLGDHTYDNANLKDGIFVYTCNVCGYQKTEAHTHDYGEWSVKTPATVFAKGEETRVCK